MTTAAELAEQATARILADLGGDHRGVVVDSPPGAGKSTLVVRVAAELADAGENVMVIAQFWSATAANSTDSQWFMGCVQNYYFPFGKEVSFPHGFLR